MYINLKELNGQVTKEIREYSLMNDIFFGVTRFRIYFIIIYYIL
jgi:hypothetical protein